MVEMVFGLIILVITVLTLPIGGTIERGMKEEKE